MPNPSPFLPVVVEIDAYDHVGARKLQALNDIEADTAKAEYGGCRALFDVSTSPAFGPSSSISMVLSGFSAAPATAARIFIQMNSGS